MGVKQTVLPDGQPSNIAFTVLAQLSGNGDGHRPIQQNGEGRNFDSTSYEVKNEFDQSQPCYLMDIEFC